MKRSKSNGPRPTAALKPRAPEIEQFLGILARVARRIADEETPRRSENNKK